MDVDKTFNNFLVTREEGRRDFIKKSSLIGFGLVCNSSLFQFSKYNIQPGIKGSRISSSALLDDCFRLVSVSNEVPKQLKEMLKPNLYKHVPGNTARLGRTFPNDKESALELFYLIKNAKEEEKTGNFSEEKLALAIGVLALVGYNIEMSAPQNQQQAGIYLDASILKDMSGKNPSDSIPGNPEDLADLLRGMGTRFLTRIHTTIPDEDDPEQWILRVDQWRRDLDQYYNSLAKVYMQPEKDKINQLLVKSNIYNNNDDLIKMVRIIQQARWDNKLSNNIVPQITRGLNQSSYSRALAKGYNLIVAALKFYENKIGESQFNKIFSEI